MIGSHVDNCLSTVSDEVFHSRIQAESFVVIRRKEMKFRSRLGRLKLRPNAVRLSIGTIDMIEVC